MDLLESGIRMLSALAVVLGLMGLAAFVTKRFSFTQVWRKSGTPLVQVLGSGYVNSRAGISLVAVAGEVLIVGTTATDLVPLGRIADQHRVYEMLRQAGLPSHSPGGVVGTEQAGRDDRA